MNKEKYKVKFAENLMSQQVMIPQVFTAGYDIIDEICSDYESRTCGNCRYFEDQYCTLASINYENGVVNGMMPQDYEGYIAWLIVNKDFGCNKFEMKTNGL